MQFEDSRKTIKDPSILSNGFMFCDGYVFEANRYPANVFDAIVIRNPSNAQHWGGKKICSEHSLCEHIAYINTHTFLYYTNVNMQITQAYLLGEIYGKEGEYIKECMLGLRTQISTGTILF